MVIYNVRIRERVLTLISKTNNITVGGNKGDQVVFDFDSEWGESYEKVAVFVWNGKYHSVKFTGTTCEVPPIYESNNFRLGVYIGDDMEDEPYLSSTTIVIPCSLSARDFATNPQDSMNKSFVNRAEAAAVRAEEAADRAEAAGGGSDFEKRLSDLEKNVDDLIYEEITITSFSASPSIAEIGSTVSSVVLSWSVNKTPKALTLDGSTIGANNSSKTVTGAFTTNKTWTLKATDEREAAATKTVTLAFLNGIYYGVALEPTNYDSTFLLNGLDAGLNKTLKNSKLTSFSVTAAGDEYIYYCLPKRMGTCSFKVGGFDGGFSLVDTISFTNASGYTEDYYIYRSDNTGLGQTSVTVS